MTLNGQKSEKKETVFTHFVDGLLAVVKTNASPKQYKNVLHIGHDEGYGDVFKAWGDHENEFTIHFGTKGDEF